MAGTVTYQMAKQVFQTGTLQDGMKLTAAATATSFVGPIMHDWCSRIENVRAWVTKRGGGGSRIISKILDKTRHEMLQVASAFDDVADSVKAGAAKLSGEDTPALFVRMAHSDLTPQVAQAMIDDESTTPEEAATIAAAAKVAAASKAATSAGRNPVSKLCAAARATKKTNKPKKQKQKPATRPGIQTRKRRRADDKKLNRIRAAQAMDALVKPTDGSPAMKVMAAARQIVAEGRVDVSANTVRKTYCKYQTWIQGGRTPTFKSEWGEPGRQRMITDTTMIKWIMKATGLGQAPDSRTADDKGRGVVAQWRNEFGQLLNDQRRARGQPALADPANSVCSNTIRTYQRQFAAMGALKPVLRVKPKPWRRVLVENSLRHAIAFALTCMCASYVALPQGQTFDTYLHSYNAKGITATDELMRRVFGDRMVCVNTAVNTDDTTLLLQTGAGKEVGMRLVAPDYNSTYRGFWHFQPRAKGDEGIGISVKLRVTVSSWGHLAPQTVLVRVKFHDNWEGDQIIYKLIPDVGCVLSSAGECVRARPGCVRACVRACVCVCVCMCVGWCRGGAEA